MSGTAVPPHGMLTFTGFAPGGGERGAAPRQDRGVARYDVRELIDDGGMGEVWRVYDLVLGCTLAMKVIKSAFARNAAALERFRAEARLTASLQHPGTVPVHDLGELEDGRPFYTMMEVRGRLFSDALAEAWSRGLDELGRDGPDSLELRRLIEVLSRVSETMAYVHEQEVLHLDLKPTNIMLGSHGEVLVMDWGLARPVEEARRAGQVGGTYGYMPPEQKRGTQGTLGKPSDVYALGAMLAEVLTGSPPPFPDCVDAPGQPDELVLLARRAIALRPASRPANAGEFAAELSLWLDGARRRERARTLAEEADARRGSVYALQDRLTQLRQEAARLEDTVRPWHPIERKRQVWAASDEVAQQERALELEIQALAQGYAAALREHADCVEAHRGLADLYHDLHASAEAQGDRRAEARYETLLRQHDRGRYSRYLRGDGALTLHTDPPGARARLLQLVERDRRLVPVERLDLGHTPVNAMELPMGSYVVEILAEGRRPVHYPVHVPRLGHWDGVPPEGGAPRPIPLPRESEHGPDDVYVPPGWFLAGGDPLAMYTLPRARVWVEGFVLRRFPVRNREYMDFLAGVEATCDADELAHLLPRMRAGPHGPGQAFYDRGADGRLAPIPDAEGDLWDLDWPVLHVDLRCALALAAWEARRSGQPWRLPSELEWEKAARGVDGRFFPWGDAFDAAFACMVDSWREGERRLPCRVEEFPLDESPYGARGLAGNVRCWTLDRFEKAPALGSRALLSPAALDDEALWTARGGGWNGNERSCRAARRAGYEPRARQADLGIRLARSWPV